MHTSVTIETILKITAPEIINETKTTLFVIKAGNPTNNKQFINAEKKPKFVRNKSKSKINDLIFYLKFVAISYFVLHFKRFDVLKQILSLQISQQM